jgi:beta-phosphoglucomutase
MSSAPKALLFDFDGVLAQTMADNFKAWQHTLHARGADIGEREYFLMEGMKLSEVARVLCERHGVIGADHAAIVKEKEEFYLANHSFKLYPGVEEFTTLLAEKGVPMAIVSAGLYDRLARSMPESLLRRFGAVVTGDKTERGKPFPDPYLKGAEELGVPIEDCIVVENAPLGVQSAKSAGAFCVAICSTLGEDELREADEIIPDFRALHVSPHINTLLQAYP